LEKTGVTETPTNLKEGKQKNKSGNVEKEHEKNSQSYRGVKLKD